MSCTAPGECTAVGFYPTNTKTFAYVALIASEANGVWGNPVPLPGFAALDVSGAIGSLVISCSALGDCAVGGDYSGQAPPAGQEPTSAFTATEIDGTWGNAQPVDTSELPGGSDSTILSISCTSPGNCAAAGRYWIPTSGSPTQAFLLTETNGTWSAAQQVPGLGSLPTASPVYANISVVSCGSDGNCTAVGEASTRAPYIPIIVDEVDGTWGNVQRVPGIASGISGDVSAVSCSGAGDCTAAGAYISNQHGVGFGVTETGGSWGTATPIPGLLASPAALSCAAPGDCTLASSNETFAPIWTSGVSVATQSNGAWGKAAEIPGLPSASVGSGAVIDSVSCSAPGTCSAAGFMYRDGGANIAFVANQTAGTWGSAQNVARTSNTTTDAISCGGPGYCSVAVSQLYIGSVYAPHEIIVNEATASAPVVRPIPAKVTYGDETFRLPITVTSPDGGTPTGSVSVAAGSHVLCTATLANGAATCLITKASLPAGTSHLVATYGGDAAYVNSTSPPATLTIAKATTKTTLALARTTITYGNETVERLSVTVTGQYGTTPTGKVAIRAGNALIATIALTNGKGSYNLTARQLKAGTYWLTAAYAGSTDFSTSDSAAKALKVAK
jgi:hypothetical protein